MSGRVDLVLAAEGAFCDVVLVNEPGNILDATLMRDLSRALRGLPDKGPLRAIRLRAEGEHFCYGASVQEHRPGEIAPALDRLEEALSALAAAPAPTVACVQGVCLGGGFELVLACDVILTCDDAEFGLPEIELGVFPPAAAALLPLRLPANEANRLMLSGARLSAPRALELGLVAELVGDEGIEMASRRWLERHLLDKSAVALRQTARAARVPLLRALETDWPLQRRRYLGELMRHHDAQEGVEAFLAKRPPRWRHE